MADYLRAKITKLLIDYFESDHRRIEHALQVLHYADNLLPDHPSADPDILIACALLHDVGIKKSEALHSYNNGKTQEQYGPDVAESLLKTIEFPPEKIEKVKQIISNHHSPNRYDYIELNLLKQADRIVNKQDPD